MPDACRQWQRFGLRGRMGFVLWKTHVFVLRPYVFSVYLWIEFWQFYRSSYCAWSLTFLKLYVEFGIYLLVSIEKKACLNFIVNFLLFETWYHSVDQAGFEVAEISFLASRVLALRVYGTTLWLTAMFEP